MAQPLKNDDINNQNYDQGQHQQQQQQINTNQNNDSKTNQAPNNMNNYNQGKNMNNMQQNSGTNDNQNNQRQPQQINIDPNDEKQSTHQQQNYMNNSSQGQNMNNDNNMNNMQQRFQLNPAMYAATFTNFNQYNEQLLINLIQNIKVNMINNHEKPRHGEPETIVCIECPDGVPRGNNIKSCLRFLSEHSELNSKTIRHRLEDQYNYFSVVYDYSEMAHIASKEGFSEWLIKDKFGNEITRYKIMIICEKQMD